MNTTDLAKADEAAIAAWLAEHEGEMFKLLEKFVNTDSGSYDKAGEIIRDFLQGWGIDCDTIAVKTHGDALRATVPGRTGGGNRPVLLAGHRDTVFPKGEPQRRPFRIADSRAYACINPTC